MRYMLVLCMLLIIEVPLVSASHIEYITLDMVIQPGEEIVELTTADKEGVVYFKVDSDIAVDVYLIPFSHSTPDRSTSEKKWLDISSIDIEYRSGKEKGTYHIMIANSNDDTPANVDLQVPVAKMKDDTCFASMLIGALSLLATILVLILIKKRDH